MEMDKTAQALLYLMRCALQGTAPKLIEGVDYEALYKLSVFHSVVAMAAMALESGVLLTESHASPECIKKWKDAKVKAIRKNVLLDTEREQIFQYFEEQGIWYLPLKGSVLKDMYPRMGMRQMADNDILFDPAFQRQVKAYMESGGYQTVSFGIGSHDVYEKPPVYNFEMHTALFNEYLFEEWAEYYENVKPRLKKDEANNFGYHFSNEDFYIYLLTHGYKHYSGSGTGIRFLADIYVFVREKKSVLNWEYISGELRTLNLYEFETVTRELAEKLFGVDGNILTDEKRELLSCLMGAGAYGTIENRINRGMEQTRWKKFQYLWKRAFPDKKFMQAYSPFCRKHIWAIPIFWIYRLLRAAVLRRNKIRRELGMVRKAE